MQAPTWDDEPQIKQPAAVPALEEPKIVEPEPQSVATPSFITEREIPAETHLTPTAPEPVAIPTKPLSPAAHTRPGAAHRGSAKFKTTDQAVVMPSSSFGSGIEKVGMQFGSLSLGGDDLDPAERYGYYCYKSSHSLIWSLAPSLQQQSPLLHQPLSLRLRQCVGPSPYLRAYQSRQPCTYRFSSRKSPLLRLPLHRLQPPQARRCSNKPYLLRPRPSPRSSARPNTPFLPRSPNLQSPLSNPQSLPQPPLPLR